MPKKRTTRPRYKLIQMVRNRTIITLDICQKKFPEIPSGTFYGIMNKLTRCHLVKKIQPDHTRKRMGYQKTDRYTVKKANDCLMRDPVIRGHDDFWRNIFAKAGGLESVLDRVRNVGSVSIPMIGLRERGQSSSWLGRIVLSKQGFLDSSGRIYPKLKDLENILPKYLTSNEMIECTVSDVENQLHLRIKRVESNLSTENLGAFYLQISSFERKLRNFIKNMAGKGFIHGLEHDLPAVVNKWRERESADIKWGIKSEKELANYADTSDYVEIIKRYQRLFVESDQELMYVMTHLAIFAINGRNPLMHSRNLNQQKYYVTKSAIGFLSEWIKRRERVRENKKRAMAKRIVEPLQPVKQETVGTYVSRRGNVIPIYTEDQRYRIGKNVYANRSFVDKVEEYLCKSEKSLSRKEIEKGLQKYFTYKALDIQIWNALRILISFGKVKRNGKGNNILYKTIFST